MALMDSHLFSLCILEYDCLDLLLLNFFYSVDFAKSNKLILF